MGIPNPLLLPWLILAVDVEEMVGGDGALAPGACDVEAGVGEDDVGENDDGESDDDERDDGKCVTNVVLVTITDIVVVLVNANPKLLRACRGQPIGSC